MMRGSSLIVAFCLVGLLSGCLASSPNKAATGGPAAGPTGEFFPSSGDAPEETSPEPTAAAQPKPLPGGAAAPMPDYEDGSLFKAFGADRFLVGTYEYEYKCRGVGEFAAAVVVAAHVEGQVLTKRIQTGEYVPCTNATCPQNGIRAVVGEGDNAWYKDFVILDEDKSISFQVPVSDLSSVHFYLRFASVAEFAFPKPGGSSCPNLSCIDLDMTPLVPQLTLFSRKRPPDCSP